MPQLILGGTKKRTEVFSWVQVQFSSPVTKLSIWPSRGTCPPIIPSPESIGWIFFEMLPSSPCDRIRRQAQFPEFPAEWPTKEFQRALGNGHLVNKGVELLVLDLAGPFLRKPQPAATELIISIISLPFQSRRDSWERGRNDVSPHDFSQVFPLGMIFCCYYF